MLARANLLIKDASQPFHGVGKPEPLRGELRGWWSRRIDAEHRLVYRPSEQGLLIAQCRNHY
jgi:toxin YoeB